MPSSTCPFCRLRSKTSTEHTLLSTYLDVDQFESGQLVLTYSCNYLLATSTDHIIHDQWQVVKGDTQADCESTVQTFLIKNITTFDQSAMPAITANHRNMLPAGFLSFRSHTSTILPLFQQSWTTFFLYIHLTEIDVVTVSELPTVSRITSFDSGTRYTGYKFWNAWIAWYM